MSRRLLLAEVRFVKSIAFFNNKGGVGKTTLACNLVAYLNSNKSKRVLLIDADPQCNATQAMLDDDLCDEIYFESTSAHHTLLDCVAPLEMGEPGINTDIVPLLGTENRFSTDLVPGHPRMSIIEDRLSDAWSELQGRQVRGYRITSWCYQLLRSLEKKYDLVVFDVGPSLGALNRSVILACDYIVTPFGCDIFSLLGIRNISQWITNWKRQYDRAILDAQEDQPHIFTQYQIPTATNAQFRFLGYSVQQYVTRTFKTGRRPVRSYDQIMKEIPGTVRESMAFLRPPGLTDDDLELGHIPYLYSLVPMAQAAKAPIHALTSSDGLVGSQYAQVRKYSEVMNSICDKLLANLQSVDITSLV